MKKMKLPNLEQVLLSILMLVIITSFCFDVIHFNIPALFAIKYQDIDELYTTIFTVQASTSAICLAIVALLANSIQEKAYGLSLSRYIMYEKPHFLKHNRIILVIIALILFNYIFLAKQFYNTLLSFFLTSIVLLLFMLRDVVKIFTAKDAIIIEISHFIINSIPKKKSLLKSFRDELIMSLETNNSILAKADFEFLLKLFKKECSGNSSQILSDLEEICVDSIITVTTSNNSVMNIVTLTNINEIYKCANNNSGDDRRVIKLSIFDKTSKFIYRLLTSLDFTQFVDTHIIQNLHIQLYKNVILKEPVNGNNPIRENGFDLHYWTAKLYYSFFINNRTSFSESEQAHIKGWLFDDTNNLLRWSHFEVGINNILVQELSLYTKALIDNGEEKILDEFFFGKDVFSHQVNNTFINQILIYLYYLACREELADEKAINFSRSLLTKHKKKISNYLFSSMRRNISEINSDVIVITDHINTWEIMPHNQAKWVVMENVVNDYFIWTLVNVIFDDTILYDSLKEIIRGREFSFYERYIGPHNQKRLWESFKQYTNTFFEKEEVDRLLSEKYERLQFIITKLYKNSEIEHSKKIAITVTESSDFVNSARETLTAQIHDVFKWFLPISKKTEEQLISKPVFLSSFGIQASFMDNEYINNYLKEYFYNGSISILLLILKDSINIKTIPKTRIDKLSSFFNQIEEVHNLDTIIGNADVFYGDKDLDRYLDFEKGKTVLKHSYDADSLIAICSKKLFVEITDIAIDLIDYSDEEIENISKMEEDGNIMFNITNDIFLPFSKNELYDYIHNTRKKLTVSAQVLYSLSDPPLGAGIIIEY